MWGLKRRGLPPDPRNSAESLWIAGLIMAIAAVLAVLGLVAAARAAPPAGLKPDHIADAGRMVPA